MKSDPITVSKVWILEDNQVFAKQMRRLIDADECLECSHHFETPDGFFEAIRNTAERPDVLLLDLGLPGMDGLQVLVEVRKLMPEVKVLILSASDDREKVYHAICNGASGYLLKTSGPLQIIAGINEVVHGAAALSSTIATMILNGFSKHGPVERYDPLTDREEEVLKFLVKGITKKEIADRLFISPHTVDMHLRSVYRKLHVRSQTEAVSKALRQGLV